jgi:hypothetical protein
MQERDITQYKVHGLRGNEQVFIRATTTAQDGTVWAIIKNEKSRGKYATAKAALHTLESALNDLTC